MWLKILVNTQTSAHVYANTLFVFKLTPLSGMLMLNSGKVTVYQVIYVCFDIDLGTKLNGWGGGLNPIFIFMKK